MTLYLLLEQMTLLRGTQKQDPFGDGEAGTEGSSGGPLWMRVLQMKVSVEVLQMRVHQKKVSVKILASFR